MFGSFIQDENRSMHQIAKHTSWKPTGAAGYARPRFATELADTFLDDYNECAQRQPEFKRHQ